MPPKSIAPNKSIKPELFLTQDIIQNDVFENLSPYELLSTMMAFGKHHMESLSSNDIWERYLEKYFPDEYVHLEKNAESLRRLSRPVESGLFKKHFVMCAREFHKEAELGLRNFDYSFCKGREHHLLDHYFMKKLLGSNLNEADYTKVLKNHYNKGLLYYAAHNATAIQELLFVYSSEKERLDAVDNLISRTDFLQYSAKNSELLKTILSLYHVDQRLIVVKKAAKVGGQNMLHAATCSPESFHTILSLYPEEEHLKTVDSLIDGTRNFLQDSVKHPEILKTILSLYPEKEHLAVVDKAREVSGKSVLNAAVCSPESLEMLLLLYPTDEARLAAAVKQKDKYNNPLIYSSAGTPKTLKMILSLYPKEEILAAVKEKDEYGNTVLHLDASETPESVKVILTLLPIERRLEILKEKNNDGISALQLAASNSESLKYILELLPEKERPDAAKEKDSRDSHKGLFAAIDNPRLLAEILTLLPPESRLEIITERSRHHLDDTMLEIALSTPLPEEINKPESLKVMFELLPEKDRLKAMKIEDISRRGVLPHIANNLKLLEAILALLSPENLLEAIKIQDNSLKHKTVLHKVADQYPEYLKKIFDTLSNSNNSDKDAIFKLKLFEKLLSLEKRPNEYNNYGLFKYCGAFSKSQEITAITHFLYNKVTPANAKTLAQGDIGKIIKKYAAAKNVPVDTLINYQQQSSIHRSKPHS